MAAPDPTTTRLVTTDGELIERTLTASQQTRLWAGSLHPPGPGYVEVVAARRQPDGTLRMRSRTDLERYPQSGDVRALARLADRDSHRGDEVFATPLTRRHRKAGRDGGIQAATVCWVDIDDPAGLDLLRGFSHRPHLVVYSGSGGGHAYWKLGRAISPAQVEAINRKLAGALAGDLASCDQARIMRLPGTTNHKAGKPCRLAWCDLARLPHDPHTLVEGLKDPAEPAPEWSQAQLRRHLAFLQGDDATRLDPPVYFQALAGVAVPGGGGHVPCPLPDHDETISSCMVYAGADRGWWCYGCQRGGTIYDLASLLDGGPSGRALAGDAFREVKAAVHDRLGLDPPGNRENRLQRPRRPAEKVEAQQ